MNASVDLSGGLAGDLHGVLREAAHAGPLATDLATGATVVLRAGDLTSTAGKTDAAGAFKVRARVGTFGVTVVSGLALIGYVALLWSAHGFGPLDVTRTLRPVLIGTVLVALGMQTLLMSLFLIWMLTSMFPAVAMRVTFLPLIVPFSV